MKIGIQTWGSDGDINPFIALAGGLSAAGHDVTLAVTSVERKSYGRFAERLGFALIQVGHVGRDDKDLVRFADAIYGAANPVKQLDVIIHEMFEPGVGAMFEAARSLCAESDLVIGHFLVHPLQAAAEKAGRPYLTVNLNQSCISSPYRPPTGVPDMGKCLNGIAWKIAIRILDKHILPPINRLREREGLKPAPTFRDVWESRLCNLIAVSPEFCIPAPDWGPNQRVCGFFRVPEEAGPWDPPETLVNFLGSGPPPVYMTFGSMLSARKDATSVTKTTRLLVDAARAAGCRAIIQSRWEDIRGIPEYGEIYRLNEAPHGKIFPYCSAVVHHGGAGTTQTAGLCGCPSVVVSHMVDQYFWGRQLRRLGVAPKVLEWRKVTPGLLGREIRRVLDTPAMSRRAQILGDTLRAENGVKVAVAAVERVISDLGLGRRITGDI